MSDAATHFQTDPLRPAGHPTAASAAPTVVAVHAANRPRVWPGVLIVALMWAAIVGPGLVPQLQGTMYQMFGMLWGAMGGAALVGIWWLFASRVQWADRFLLLLFFATSFLAGRAVSHESFNYQNYGPIVRGLPLATTAFVLWLLLTPGISWPVRRLGAAVAVLLAWGYCCSIRFDGVYGDFRAQVSWRWAPTEEERFLADLKEREASHKVADASSTTLELRPGDWPSFRGPDRDSRLKGVRLATDWKANPPRQLWRHLIGPGWSSFAVVGDRIFTQEQRGEEEAVVCYDANTGAEIWAHTDHARFEEVAGGIGPRSTPTFADGKLYALGAKGKLNCFDPATGKVVWSRDIVADSGAKVPMWGFSSSPLVAEGIVMVFAGGGPGKSVLGYHASSGELAWSAGDGKDSYSSPGLLRRGGTEVAVIATEKGVTAFEPAGGKVVWEYEYPTDRPPRVAQPAPVGESDLLVGTPMKGMRRVRLNHEGDKWDGQQVWETKDIKPYYNDLVIYKDHVYGFDGSFFTCVGLEDGARKWKERGYGNGQVLLLADQGLLLISAESGDVALVEATPERHKELARFPAIRGKTWNHPVVARGKLFIRNGDEVACYQLPEEKGKKAAE